MSEDEDEELAMLRLQALMSKRRGGAGASKDLPIPPLLLGPTEPVAPVSSEAPLAIPTTVVTAAFVTIADPTEGVGNNGGAYRHPRFVREQASHCSSNGIALAPFVKLPIFLVRVSAGIDTGTVPGRNNVASVRSRNIFCSRAGTCETLLDI